MTQRLDLAIAPGKHLGWFRLGTSLWDIIRLLRDRAALIPAVELKYSDENPFAADIVLRLASNGIELRFEPLTQRLKLIKVDDFSKLRLTYQGGEVSSTKALPTFLLAYKLFGPTYPGEFDGAKHLYTLSYPGLSLVFPIPEKHMLLYQSSADLPLEFPDGTTPVASHMYIFYGADWTSATPLPISTLARNIQDSGSPNRANGRYGEGKAELERVVAKVNYGVGLQFAGASQQKCQILLQITTPQDLLADLGSPLSIFYKEEDKMKIHLDTKAAQQYPDDEDDIVGAMDDIEHDRTSRATEGSQKPNDYFYNYFHLGIDVLFDGSTHRCKKIVMHSNVPGHFDFQSYKRCPFVLYLPSAGQSHADLEAAKLPPMAPQTTHSPSPTHHSHLTGPHPPHLEQDPEEASSLHTKSKLKKKAKGTSSGLAPGLSSHGQEGNSSFSPSSASGDSARGSPDLLSSSPYSSSVEPGSLGNNSSGLMPGSNSHPLPSSPMSAIATEKGITPDMTIAMMMTLLESSSALVHSGSASVPNKPVVLAAGSSSQNPFGPTMLNGTDGVVFEAMRNGHVATVILY